MNREMMWYWGLVHDYGDYWISNNTARKDHAILEQREMPPDTGLTAAEARSVHYALGVLPRDVGWDQHLLNYSEPLNVVCANWLDSCKAERCFKLAEETKTRRVYCPSWNLTMQCLDLETNYTQPGYLGNSSNGISRYSYLTDQLPGVTAPPPIIQPRFGLLALIAHIILAIVHFIDWQLQERHRLWDYKPKRVTQMQCRFATPKYTIDGPDIVDANTSVLIDRLTTGNKIINQYFYPSVDMDAPHDIPANRSIDQMLEDLARVSGGGSIGWREFMAEGYYSDFVNDIWAKVTEGYEHGQSEIEFGHGLSEIEVKNSSLVERSLPPPLIAGHTETAQLVNATQAAGSLLILGVAVVAICCWHARHRRVLVSNQRTDDFEMGVVAKQARVCSADSTTCDARRIEDCHIDP